MSFNDDHEYVRIQLNTYTSPEDHIDEVRKAAEGLVKATVECELEPDYGGDRAVMYVNGYKLLTPEEKAVKRAKQREEQAKRDQYDREQYERLKAKFGG